MQRKIRVLVGKPGSMATIAAPRSSRPPCVMPEWKSSTPACTRQRRKIVEAAIQEDVDVVALSILSGAAHDALSRDPRLMKARGIGDKLLSGGGIIPAEDMVTLTRMGVGKLFGPGASTQDIAAYLRDWFVSVHGAGLARADPSVAIGFALVRCVGARSGRFTGAGARASRGGSDRTEAPCRSRATQSPPLRRARTRRKAAPKRPRNAPKRPARKAGSRSRVTAKRASAARPRSAAKRRPSRAARNERRPAARRRARR